MFCIMALLSYASAQADNLKAFLKMRDGTVQQIEMASSSQIELHPFLLKIQAPVDPEYDILFLFDDVATLSFEAPQTGIHAPGTSALVYRLDADRLTIEGITDCSSVQVYDTSGSLLRTERVQDNACQLVLSGLPKGMLVVKVNHQTIKILKQ